MSVKRGEVVLANVRFFSGTGSKKRPVLVVQSDHNNSRMQTTIVALITSNVSRVHEATQFLIDISTPDGRATGLLQNSAVKCENLLTIPQSEINKTIGKFSDQLMQQIDQCLKMALAIP